MTILSPYLQLLKLIDFYDRFIGTSDDLDDQSKKALLGVSNYVRTLLLGMGKASAYQAQTLESELLRYWKDKISVTSERFWHTLKENNITAQRKDPLQFALEKGRFRLVEHGIDARNNWQSVKSLDFVSSRFSQADIQKIEQIIKDDELKRNSVLRKCLEKGGIPQSQYLKFGECMAYFANCRLFDSCFNRSEVEQLYLIWKDFKSN